MYRLCVWMQDRRRQHFESGRMTTHIYKGSTSQMRGSTRPRLPPPLPRWMLLGKFTVVHRGCGKRRFDHQNENRIEKASPISTLDASLHILIAHYQTTLLIPRHQHHPLVRPRVQLVQAREDMGEVHHRVEVFVHLVKDVVSEKFDDVSVAGF